MTKTTKKGKTMKTLKEKIAKATAPRMEAKTYGPNKGELEEKTSDYITITPEELSFLVRMRVVSNISVTTDMGAYIGDTNSCFKPYHSISITKKTAKKIASDFARSAKNFEGRKDVDGPIMAKVFVWKYEATSYRPVQLSISLS
jgi:hypothetical protein